MWPVGQAVKTEASHAFNIGSIPVRVIFAPLAQLVEQLTLNQWAKSSSLLRSTILQNIPGENRDFFISFFRIYYVINYFLFINNIHSNISKNHACKAWLSVTIYLIF